MLEKNIKYIDHWTILDTGSTDGTVENIKRIMKNKKGQLYQEPFINFGESRNRCLELAGTKCKFNIMLDDSYIINGLLREFLLFVRGDQYADSFSFYIKQLEIEYCSNRIFKSQKRLKYLYSIHEVIQDYDNVNVLIPIEQAYIYDIPSDDMFIRTSERKEKDIELLKEEIRKQPNDPRHYYYLAQTYVFLKKYELAYENFLKRGYHHVEGFVQEKYCALLEAAKLGDMILQKPWEECENLYKEAFKVDNERPETMYFLGLHYYNTTDFKKAYDFLLKGYEVGYPAHRQYCLNITLSTHFLPKLLVLCCEQLNIYDVGEKVSNYFLEKNKSTDDNYDLMKDLNKIFTLLNKSCISSNLNIIPTNYSSKPLCIFVCPGGFSRCGIHTIRRIFIVCALLLCRYLFY